MICLRGFQQKHVQLKVGKSTFHYLRQISFERKILFLFNQLYFHCYLLLWFLLRSYWSFLNSTYWLCFIKIFHVYNTKIHLLPFQSFLDFWPHCYFYSSIYGNYLVITRFFLQTMLIYPSVWKIMLYSCYPQFSQNIFIHMN